MIVTTRYNLENFAAYLQGLTLFQLPLEDEAAFTAICRDALATLEGHEFPPFRLGKKQPPDRWGDCYAAYDTGVKRDIFITMLRDGATEQGCPLVPRVGHGHGAGGPPNAQAVYQAGRYQGRDFFAREKWEAPNLSEMAAAGRGIDGRLAAQILHVAGGRHPLLGRQRLSHTPIGATDVSVSPQGIIKVANCVDPSLPATPPGMVDLTGLAAAVSALLPNPEQAPPRVQTLLAQLLAGPVPLAESVGAAQAIEIELAPEREIEVTAERQVARVAVHTARRKQKRNIYRPGRRRRPGPARVAYLVYARFFAPPPSREFNQMATIPAGPYTFQDGPDRTDHPFYIDKYEVTLGQYLKFLIAVRDAKTDKAWRDPKQKGEKNHEPADWDDHVEDGKTIAGIFTSIRTGSPITRNTSRSTTRSSTSTGTTRRPTPTGRASGCRPRRNGRRRPAVPTVSFSPGARRLRPTPIPRWASTAPFPSRWWWTARPGTSAATASTTWPGT